MTKVKVGQVSDEFPNFREALSSCSIARGRQLQATGDLSTEALAMQINSTGKITTDQSDVQHTAPCKLRSFVYSPDCSLEGKSSSTTPPVNAL